MVKRKITRKKVRNSPPPIKDVRVLNSSGKNKSNIVLGLFIMIGILILVLVALIIQSFGFLEKSLEPRLFMIKDECSLVMGNLIHQIRDGGECRIKCVNECNVRDMNFVSFDFEVRNNDCNSCSCWCN